jgi:hypothetical protein
LAGKEGALDETRAVGHLALVGGVCIHDLAGARGAKIAGGSGCLGKEEEETTVLEGGCVGEYEIGGGEGQHFLKGAVIGRGRKLGLNGTEVASIILGAESGPEWK